jgi:hypothetical protein
MELLAPCLFAEQRDLLLNCKPLGTPGFSAKTRLPWQMPQTGGVYATGHPICRLRLRSGRLDRGGGARWRRSDILIPQSPGCRQRTSLASVTAWHLLPGSGAFSALGHFGSTTRLGVAVENRHRGVTSARAFTARTAGHCGPSWPQECIGHGEHGESLRVTAGTAGPTGHSSTTDTTCAATGPKAGQQRAAQTDVAARAAQGDRNFGRASERFVSERLRRGERWRPGPLARRLSGERPATAVTACTEPVTAGAGVTAPGHGGHGAGHGAPHSQHGAGHSDHGDGGRHRPLFPRRRRPPGQQLSPGRACGTKSTGEAKRTSRATWVCLVLYLKLPDLLHLFTSRRGAREFEPEPADTSESFLGPTAGPD